LSSPLNPIVAADSFSIEHWNVASNQGRHVAHTITNPDAANVFNKVPIFWSSAGGGLRYCGSGAGYDDIHIDGDISKELKVSPPSDSLCSDF
jgi:hypothetical protein